MSERWQVEQALEALADPELAASEYEFARAVVLLAEHLEVSIACAESLTGGMLCEMLTSVPGASAVVRGGIVAYATDLKARLLGVDSGLLAARGPVDAEVAAQMAQGASERLDADLGLACTGVAGPDAPEGIVIGTVHIAVFNRAANASRVRTLALEGGRDEIRVQTCISLLGAALDVLLPGSGFAVIEPKS